MSDTNPLCMHHGRIEVNKNESNFVYEEILEWFCPDYQKACEMKDCENCENKDSCDEDARILLKQNTEKPPMERLGQICVYSECGYMPKYVVEQLADISNLYCNHMG